MSTHSILFRRLVSVTFSALAILWVSAAAFAQDCPTELGVSTGFTSLASGNTTSKQKGVDEWDGDVVKFRVTMPGVVAITGAGAGSQNSLYTNTAEDPAFVDSARLGTGLSDLQAVAGPGDFCVQVRPPASATGNFTVEVSFIDVCHLGNVDDHGASFLCATPVAIDSSASGEIDSGTTSDVDVFTFTLTASATITIESTGSTDVDGTLFDEQGSLIASDADSGQGSNFLIVHSLAAGKYYVRVEGADGTYGVNVND